MVTVFLTRDSVCAGDDVDAPHDKKVIVPRLADPEALAGALSTDYLASVAGVGHSWTCVLNGVDIAVLSVSSIRGLVSESPFAEENRVHFVYHSATY